MERSKRLDQAIGEFGRWLQPNVPVASKVFEPIAELVDALLAECKDLYMTERSAAELSVKVHEYEYHDVPMDGPKPETMPCPVCKGKKGWNEQIHLEFPPYWSVCYNCKGTGKVPKVETILCPVCDGKKEYTVSTHEGSSSTLMPCEHCDQTGKVPKPQEPDYPPYDHPIPDDDERSKTAQPQEQPSAWEPGDLAMSGSKLVVVNETTRFDFFKVPTASQLAGTIGEDKDGKPLRVIANEDSCGYTHITGFLFYGRGTAFDPVARAICDKFGIHILTWSDIERHHGGKVPRLGGE